VTTQADLIVRGRIATLAGPSSAGFAWAEAIAVLDGRVVATGTAADIDSHLGPGTRRIDLEPDDVAIPGLIDAHLHLVEVGLSAERADVSTAPTAEGGLAIIAAAHEGLPSGAWLQGHGWLADRWAGWPTAQMLERAAPGRPAALWAHDHHALWTNETALRVSGIDSSTADPAGGTLRRLDDGRPEGVLHEAAARLVTSHIPVAGPEDLARGIVELGRRLVALGVVGIHDPGALSLQHGLGPGLEAYRRLAAAGDLPLRVHACIREEQVGAAIDGGLRSGDPLPDGDDGSYLRTGWLKLFADGTLGSRTAAMLAPFEPEPDGAEQPAGGLGIWITPPERLTELASRAAAAGIVSQIHAIGDRAVRAALDALEPVSRRGPVMPRIEHVQLADAGDVPRFARAGIAASVQPIHLRSDAAAARRLWGARAESSGYRLRSLLDSGAMLAFGTDAPVESIDPWPGLEMAVARTSPAWPDGDGTFGAHEAVTLPEALRAATVGPATSAGCHDRGRLAPGCVADLAIIPASAIREPVEPGGRLGDARPRMVLVGGRVSFEA
jgi:predicted amidohydrolase YtcJ